MKKNQKFLNRVVVASLALVWSGNAFAVSLGDSGTGNNASSVNRDSTFAGGEFKFMRTSGALLPNSGYATATKATGTGYTPDGFQTFCLERGEFLDSPVDFVVNDEAVAGGGNGGTSGDQGGDVISVGTAWLYHLFATGVLAGYDYTVGSAGRKADAKVLQEAIWSLEDELGNPSSGSNYYYDLAVNHFGSIAGAEANNTSGGYGVWVLNNTEPVTGTTRQDMLYFDGVGQLVPDAGTSLVLLGLALGSLSVLPRWRMFKRDER
jgi:hypothetical protein